MKVSEIIDSLNFGDLITVEWLDASEAPGPLEHGRWDTPVQSAGYFLGIKGRKTRHVLIAKEIVNCREYHYNVLPIAMIQSISIQKRNAQPKRVKHVLKKSVARTWLRHTVMVEYVTRHGCRLKDSRQKPTKMQRRLDGQ